MEIKIEIKLIINSKELTSIIDEVIDGTNVLVVNEVIYERYQQADTS